MKPFLPLAILTASTLGFLAGCGHFDLNAPGPDDRVLDAVVTARSPVELPANAELIVRVVDLTKGETRAEVLGEQTIKNPGHMPIPVHIEYRAGDKQLRSTVDVEARISEGRRLVYMTMARHPITAGNVNEQHTIEVEPVSGR